MTDRKNVFAVPITAVAYVHFKPGTEATIKDAIAVIVKHNLDFDVSSVAVEWEVNCNNKDGE